MTDYAELIGANRLYAATLRQVDSERDQREADYLEENATALETLLRERDEARLQCDGLEERGDLALKELNEARIGVVDGGIRSGKLQAEVARLTAENARLRDKAENVVIAHGMGWDMDGVIEALRDVLPAKP